MKIFSLVGLVGIVAATPSAWAANTYVGIGTTSPSSQLTVLGNAGQSTPALGAGTLYLDDPTDGVGSGGAIIFGGLTGSMTAGIKAYLTNGTSPVSSGNLNFYTGNSSSLVQQMTILSNGNVGIGTTSPTDNLDVNGQIAASAGPGYLIHRRGGLGGVFAESNGDISIFSGGGSRNLIANASGYVGIGTTTPGYPLTVSNSSATLWTIVGIGQNYGVLGESNTTGYPSVEGYNNSSGAYGQLGSTYGVYGLGVSNNWAGYFIGGYGVYGGANVAGQYGVEGNNTATGTWALLGYSGWGLYCGGGTCGGPVAWSNTSDQRLKEDIRPLTGALAKILQLEGVSFHWKDRKRDQAEGEKIGLIAQNVEKVFPQAVQNHTDIFGESLPGGTKTLTYTDLIAPVVNAIKELFQIVTENESVNRRMVAEANASAARDKASMQAEIDSLRREVTGLRRYLCEKDSSSPTCGNP